MIRVSKSAEPQELKSKGYTSDEVKHILLQDHHEKCYLCERHTDLDFEVEHLESKDGAPELTNVWHNLFLACKYCNDRKKHLYDDIPHPDEDNWEDIIPIKMDTRNRRVEICSTNNDPKVIRLIELLLKLHNGKGQKRNLMEQRFWQLLSDSYNAFTRHLLAYIDNPDEEHRNIVLSDLDINAEYLSIKYNYIKSIPSLYADFRNDVIWNKK